MMKHDIASPSSMLVNEECFSRRLRRTSGYREALNLTRESRIDGDPFLWRRCWSTRKSFYPKDCEISSTLLRSFVRGIGRKFKILDIISFLNLSFEKFLRDSPQNSFPKKESFRKSSAPRPRVTNQFPMHEGDPVESIIYAIDTNLPRHERISILIRGPGLRDGTATDAGQYRISLAAVLWKFVRRSRLDTMIGGLDTIGP